ncbi:MAG: 23S rRNA (adenine(2030)-N(6))-methyltransferase RlmJ, partial [Proteobacteria bacterium]|nr:23S rRNA (adenine(2030)-N(6))-methyltransferase RlmJ [Pseudomonadota bacterium]
GTRGWRNVLHAELLVRADHSPLLLNGCGVAIVNAPWRIDAALAPLLPALKTVLAQADGASHQLRMLA